MSGANVDHEAGNVVGCGDSRSRGGVVAGRRAGGRSQASAREGWRGG